MADRQKGWKVGGEIRGGAMRYDMAQHRLLYCALLHLLTMSFLPINLSSPLLFSSSFDSTDLKVSHLMSKVGVVTERNGIETSTMTHNNADSFTVDGVAVWASASQWECVLA